MITEALLDILLSLVAIVVSPLTLLVNAVLGPVEPLLDSFFDYMQLFLSWASVFVHPGVLRVLVQFVPAIWALRVGVKMFQWVLEIVRG